ncbi:type II toxin-antitoxin system Phd/YefM family antitoxin [Novosphingobium resinovorum]|uniref:type II toxin-antitoxin system Phd/YefM family antitoxin n=1 Tax=Novosphingobium resinovorum TaxID=158500 RepID=UPI002ED26150|nr:type II toxin-antitoxin system Phd/YefM family antitoxin [Novosphingobium resinovorum]
MNAPLKPPVTAPPVIAEVLADACVSISNLKANPAAVVAEAQERAVAVLNRNRPVAYMVSPEVWEYLQRLHEDALDAALVEERMGELDEATPVALRDLLD